MRWDELIEIFHICKQYSDDPVGSGENIIHLLHNVEDVVENDADRLEKLGCHVDADVGWVCYI